MVRRLIQRHGLSALAVWRTIRRQAPHDGCSRRSNGDVTLMLMNAGRILLMMLMCLVTDVPGPVTHGVFEHLEDAEEIHAGRRRKTAPLASDTPPALHLVTTVELTNPMPTLRPQSAARPVAHHSARKIPAAAREPAAASDDH